MVPKKLLEIVKAPEGYFKELISEAMRRQNLNPLPETEFYLVRLLSQFMTTDSLYVHDQDGHAHEEPLALMLKDALEEPARELQRIKFRHVGDISLFTAGYFQDSLMRKLVNVDYYIDLGSRSYQNVVGYTDEEMMRALYSELSAKFSSFVDVLAEVSDQTTPKDETNILRLYDLWLRTRSERAEKALKDAGILPNKTMKKSMQ